MAMSAERKQRHKDLIWRLIAFGLSGLALVMLPHAWGTYEVLVKESVSEIGKALIVAGVLGMGVDFALKRDLVRDAVEAAIGYLLPPQLRNEMEWVSGLRVIAEQTYHVTLIHKPEDHVVIVRATYDRIIKNVSGETAQVRIAGGTDEWFNQTQESRITSAEYRYFRDDKYEEPIPLPIKIMEAGIAYGSEKKVSLRHDEMIHVSVAYEMVCPEHGMESLTYRYPVENPVVQVEVPPTLKAHISIRHREPAHAYKDWQTGYLTSRVNGTLLPHQDVYVIWHLAKDLEGRPIAADPA
jgi:hypothetical protein